MDLVTIGISALLSALLFVFLEFTVIIPVLTKIIKKEVTEVVDGNLLPSITDYINGKIDTLKSEIGDAVLSKIRGVLGGRSKAVNRVMQRLADGESLDDIEDDYQESTINQVLNIVSAVADRLPSPSGANVNGSKKENIQEVNPAPHFQRPEA